MATEIRVPTLGESVTEATVGTWLKKVGDAVKVDEPLVELETDKITLEVPAPAAGIIESISVADGETVEVGALLGVIAAGAGNGQVPEDGATGHPEAKSDHPVPIRAGAEEVHLREPAPGGSPPVARGDAPEGTAPSAAKIIAEKGLELSGIAGTGKDGRITKGDALAALEDAAAKPAPVAARAPSAPADEAREERVRMSRLRQTIARRLKEAQDTAAMLTTFNEVDMSAVMKIRSEYRDLFEKKHGVKLGFMGFFVKACVQALKELPAVNGEIDGTDIVYKNYYNIGVAVGTERGLVVPVVRDADTMSIAGIEKEIGDLARSARDGSLSIESMQGGTFTITNGGIYGSLMSTPILNAPQSGILGMHKIQERPMVVGGEVVVRPMMYIALSYDHRIVDGREAVTFLVRVKEGLEDPQRMVLDL
ncbi:MAG: 2-oxoglutarate dehydrogenase complex dihydrolipoyllysine-residue succinyltransferase [Bauldia sp.]|uniref:2-oxoglutarate dehydrogenase complex dihydrolipoyllysine-residue succinyltransferase n=1 Tax=Bauldia sp. TaxID=2575872 RepID=UPI001DF5C333|nr:2-oxoglutarate dehydrogenase complex dihydrolipoyllysine-residue succinyltransferase [Bauldia sp.]MCB1495602.1 2-oxoglutarate dehydrogenase complex dihydrolipoyllysine-residue succinyltransferase [Bauldia sp.]